MDEAVKAAHAAGAGDDAFLPDQFSNPANPEAHRLGTGPEILRALDDQVDIFVAGVGTGGTITGVGEAVKSVNPKAQVIAVEPAGSAVLTGRGPGPHRIQGIGAGFVPAVLDREVIDEVLPVTDDDAIDMAHAAAAREGVLAGISCGAALWGAIEVGKRPENRGKRIVVVLPDSGERYISAPFFAPQ
jgi:cysteine synthase